MREFKEDGRAAPQAQPFYLLLTAMLLLLAAVLLTVAGCGDSSPSSASSASSESSPSSTSSTLSTSPAPGAETSAGPPRVIFTPAWGGQDAVLDVEVARTEQEKATGLMNRSSMDPDHGMIFIWSSPVRGGFWMENTLIPLSIAFVGDDGKIVDIQEMEAMTRTPHTPAKPYITAIEANKGWYAAHGIKAGDSMRMTGI